MSAPTATARSPSREEGWTKVWDPLVRVFHWTLAAGVVIAYVSDGERTIHESAGYVVLALVVVRLVWGIIGTPYARFASFVWGPRAVFAYLGDILRFRARRHLGHNPAGGAMILVLLLLVTVAGVSGWLSQTDRFFAVRWVEVLHSLSADALIATAAFHVVGVLASSLLHKENLVRAMITGKKRP